MKATIADPTNYKAWHAWAVMNFRALSHSSKENRPIDSQINVVPAVTGKRCFFSCARVQSVVGQFEVLMCRVFQSDLASS